ncbi:Eukaryotic elongation factor-2 kinase [Puccinia graminis f. sp. tritici]|uniref:Eukaryotic elongation factor-2 kinase n=1 Tax=Puccinia graminis f. sp. tritici TaxID=56615 RepID=A0A5B0NN92_PUCGR|nr:Eukaryotic elongation factor-2 kinase [Puccinia graminis f. sp. tritici]KAA1090791.1 Eukaryotic elongation factor-2 kinase [Puccinia graminis f. sp. tritici]
MNNTPEPPPNHHPRPSQFHHTPPIPISNPLVTKTNAFPAIPASHIPSQSTSSNANHAGDHAYARHLARSARTGKSKVPVKGTQSGTKAIDCSLMLYDDGVLLDKKGLFTVVQSVNLDDPNLYNNLRIQLWKAFAPEILAHTHIKSLASSPMEHLFLGHGTAKIPNKEVLSAVINDHGPRKKLTFNLMYFHPDKTSSSELSSLDVSAMLPSTKKSTKAPQTRSRKQYNTSPRKTVSSSKVTAKSWALGGSVAPKKIKNRADLASHISRLSKRPLDSIQHNNPIESPRWIIGKRLDFFTSPPPPSSNLIPESTQFQLPNGIYVIAHEITYRINFKQKIGEGTMRRAYAAEVKTDLGGGIEHVNNWVAKVRKSDIKPSITKHANDALMYEGFAYLLNEYKESLEMCEHLDKNLKIKASRIELVQHGVIATGDMNSPTDVYFLETALDGPYVKYSSNIDFSRPENEDGIDPELFALMDAFTHWSYNQSDGKYLVSDLQGVGEMLTDPQIVDMDPDCWSDGNTSAEGIKSFINMHTCHPGNVVCEALNLGRLVDLKWKKPPHSLAHLLASRNKATFNRVSVPQDSNQ